MLNKTSKALDLISNVLIIVVALLLITILAQRYFFARPDSLTPKVGKVVNLPPESFASQPKTLLLALSTTCHYCDESASFYKRLIERAKNQNTKVIAVFSQPVEESTKHLNELGLIGIEVKQESLAKLETDGTPTLILANQKGEVTDFWIGKLSSEKEAEVLDRLISK